MAMNRIGSIDGSGPILKKWCLNASQAVVAGSIVVVNGNKLDVGTAAASAGTIAGVATSAHTSGGSVDATDYVWVDINPGSIYAMPYTGSSKTSLTLEDVGKKFDIVTNAYTVDLDDITGGFCLYIGDGTEDEDENVGHFVVLGSIFNV
jgi:hypothetical protein